MHISLNSTYTPLSMPETISFLDRLSRQGIAADEAIQHVAAIHYQAKQLKQPARAVLANWLLQQQQQGQRT